MTFRPEPRTRFKGQAGEQRTLFIEYPSGNALEFKSNGDDEDYFQRLDLMIARPGLPGDAKSIARIYTQGIEDRIATFDTKTASVKEILSWFRTPYPMIVVEDERVIAFARAYPYRPRECYRGVADFSVYVERNSRGKGVGKIAMEALIDEAEKMGLWKLVSRVFPENTPSLVLLGNMGFRQVGTYEKHSHLDGIWRDVIIVERLIRSNVGDSNSVADPT